MTKGLPGSGKSTWARQQLAAHPAHFKRVNKDDLRAMLDGGVWSRRNERFVLAARDALILQALADGYSVIVDDTNLEPTHEQHIRQLVAGRAAVAIQDFTDVPLAECIARDAARAATVGERVIRRMHRMYLASPRATPPLAGTRERP